MGEMLQQQEMNKGAATWSRGATASILDYVRPIQLRAAILTGVIV